jgi:alkanesulfonate monooxygenase SsuD/methylene tetrahydromethanopterin reductase-like flavin-dependent oxidoreductase (luciferase family)
MKVSMLWGAHYEDAAAHLNAPPVSPSVCDPAIAKRTFDHFINSALFAAREHLGVCLSFHRPNVVGDTVSRYRAEAATAGWSPTEDDVVYRGFVVVADTDEKAADMESIFVPAPLRFLLRGPAPGPTDAFGAPGSPGNAHGPDSGPVPFGAGRMLFSGSPDTVVQQIEDFHAATGVGVIDLLFSSGQNPHEDVKHSVELFGREVLPRVRAIGAEARIPAAGAVRA